MNEPITYAQRDRIGREIDRIGRGSKLHPTHFDRLEAAIIGKLVPGKTRRAELTKLEASMVIGELNNTPTVYQLKPTPPSPAVAPAPLPPCTPEDPCTFCGTTDDEHECTECGEPIKDCRVERSDRCTDCERAFKLS